MDKRNQKESIKEFKFVLTKNHHISHKFKYIFRLDVKNESPFASLYLI